MGRRRNTGRKPTNLGRSLTKDKVRRRLDRQSAAQHAGLHATDIEANEGAGQLDSVLERSDLDEFMCNALLAEQRFEAERPSAFVVNSDGGHATFSLQSPRNEEKVQQELVPSQRRFEDLPIPERPEWSYDTPKDELEHREREAFLEWRRNLAKIEEETKNAVTPFEKNLEVWRQLWRVVERSDVLIQIVDARDPLLFRSAPLESYVQRVGEASGDRAKWCVLLLNKADLLTPYMRRLWARYFRRAGVDFVFWSAKAENGTEKSRSTRGRRAAAFERLQEQQDQLEDEISSESGEEKDGAPEQDEEEQDEEDSAIMSREQLLQYLRDRFLHRGGSLEPRGDRVRKGSESYEDVEQELEEDGDGQAAGAGRRRRLVVGMVGYPNVGKSSTINALAGDKKVSVRATPGHTKHFQTLLLGRDMVLCDCPGLVFPTLASSREELVLSGVLPIDHLRDPLPPLRLLLRRTASSQLRMVYGISWDSSQLLSAEEVLERHASQRGFFKDQGRPDVSRSARIILKDFVSGVLLWCRPPPDCDEHEVARFLRPLTHLEGSLTQELSSREDELLLVASRSEHDACGADAVAQAQLRAIQEEDAAFSQDTTAAAGDTDSRTRTGAGSLLDEVLRNSDLTKRKGEAKLTKTERRALKHMIGRKGRIDKPQGEVEAHSKGKYAVQGFRRVSKV